MSKSIIKSLVFGICLIISFSILGLFYYKKESTNVIRVVGQSTQRALSDTIKWTVTLNRKTGLENISKEYIDNQKQYNKLKDFLISKGIKEDEIIVSPILTNPSYGNNGQDGYMMEQNLVVVSNRIDFVESLALDMTAIYEQDFSAQSSKVSYYISDSELSKIKQELLEKASIDARERANSIAKSSNLKVSSMLEANSGVFQINEPFEKEFEGYGIYSTSRKEKDISVTVRASFKIEK